MRNVETGVSFATQGVLPGAMQPAHIHTKSQTAIIEDYPPRAPSLNVFGQGHVQSSSNGLSGQMGFPSAISHYPRCQTLEIRQPKST